MAVDIESLRLMALAHATGACFGKTVTFGRHSLAMSPSQLSAFFRSQSQPDISNRLSKTTGDGYCETLLKEAFGAESVDSVDASDYEKATIVHDMNFPITPRDAYGVVADFGTLEHVFNAPVALENLVRLCAPNGRILHVLPCNNFVGHGFYQFSPELFFQIYSQKRGFTGTRVFLAPALPDGYWYEIENPEKIGRRVNVTSRDQLHLLVITQKSGEPGSLLNFPVQQSDYSTRWNDGEEGPKDSGRGWKSIGKSIKRSMSGIAHRHKIRRKDVGRRTRSDIRRLDVSRIIPVN